MPRPHLPHPDMRHPAWHIAGWWLQTALFAVQSFTAWNMYTLAHSPAFRAAETAAALASGVGLP